MDDLRETVHGAMSGLERLFAKVPGFRGYKDKELRREADKLLRDQLAARFGDQHQRLTELQMQLISRVQIEFLDDLDRAALKLQLLVDRIKTASYGYAGLFDAVKVKEEQLDALYEFDNQMMDLADGVATKVDQLASAISAREGIAAAAEEVIEAADEANMAFSHREEAILAAGIYDE